MKLQDVKEQIQEDIRTFMLAFPDGYDDGKVKADAEYMTDSLCDIVVDNFNKLEDSKKGQFIPFGGNIS